MSEAVLLVALVLAALFTTPVWGDTLKASDPYLVDGVWVWEDIEYGNVDGHALLLDAYLPADREVHPAVIQIHGGGWRNGSKSSFRASGLDYAKAGVAGFAIDYRLSDVATYPAAVDDCLAAIRWIRAHAVDLNVDPDRLGLEGGSAGGHLVLLMAFMEPGPEDLDADGNRLTNFALCVAAKNPPTDFTADDTMHSHPAAVAFMGGPREQEPERHAEASPVTHVSPDDPPVFFIHGTADRTVPYNQALVLQSRLEEAGIPHELVTIEGAGHGLSGGDPEQIRQGMARWREFMLAHLLGEGEG